MLRKGLSARLERHVERGEELMELNRAAFERNEAASERNRIAFERNEAAFERNTRAFERLMASFDRFEKRSDQQEVFMRDMHRRNEVVVQKIIADHEKFMAKLLERDKGADRKAEQLMAELKDLREESRAQRGALLALIDRLPPPPAQAA